MGIHFSDICMHRKDTLAVLWLNWYFDACVFGQAEGTLHALFKFEAICCEVLYLVIWSEGREMNLK